MLDASRRRIESTLAEDALVLDVGGWASPLARADWVIDLMPYETRGMYGESDPAAERFTRERWVERDICDREPWPFADGQFDFAICSQTLEDVRDPIWVCAELERVARAGYVEVPSRVEEQSFGVHGPWVGWSHHHWLVDIAAGRLEFVFKSAVLQGREDCRLGAEQVAMLTPEERVQTLFWEDRLPASERIFLGPGELDEHLAAGIAGWAAELDARRGTGAREGGLRQALRRLRF